MKRFWVLVGSLAVLFAGCESEKKASYPVPEKSEIVEGIVGGVDYYHREFVLQKKDGTIIDQEFCDENVPVWVGMHVQYGRRWTIGGPYLNHCWAVDWVKEVK